MRATVSIADLRPALQRLLLAVRAKDVQPSSQVLQLTVVGPWLQLTAADLTTAARVTVPLVGAGGDGTAAVDRSMFNAIVSRAAGDTCQIAQAGTRVQVTAGEAGHTLTQPTSLSAPVFYDPDAPPTATFEAEVLLDRLQRVAHAVGTDPERPNLQMVVVREGQMLATDGRRLMALPCPVPDLAIPTAGVSALRGLLRGLVRGSMGAQGRGTLELQQTATHLHLRWQQPTVDVDAEDVEAADAVSVRSSAATFPDVTKVLAGVAAHPVTLTVTVSALQAAVQRVQVAADEALRVVKLVLDPSVEGALAAFRVETQDGTGNRAMERVPATAQGFQRDDAGAALGITTYVNIPVLLAALKAATVETVQLWFGYPDRGLPAPMRLEARLHEDAGTTYTEILLADHGEF